MKILKAMDGVANPGCLSRIQIFHHGSQVKKIPGSLVKKIPESRIRNKEFKYFTPKKCFQALGNVIRDIHPGS
jgi:hypothetical protein